MNKKQAAPLYGLFVALIWGLSFLSIKTAVAVLPPMTLAASRFVIACAVLPFLALVAKQSLGVAWRDVPVLAAGGLVGVTLYFLGENNGVRLLSASESSLIIGAIPVLTVLTERVFLKTKLGTRAYLGAVASFAGVSLIVARSAGATSSPVGYLYMGVAALSWVAYSFLTRPVSGRYGRITVTFWQSLFGLAGCVPFALTERAAWRAPGTEVVLNVLYLGILCSAVGYWLYVEALETLGAGRASVFINLIPVVSVIGAFFILGERLSGLQLAGGAVAIAGVYLATMQPRRRST
ncbi:MAG TPA: DMT family transporter [Rectinemataceae bacterium]|nr:DMT family transporter [Rectinemataceae bacterium]